MADNKEKDKKSFFTGVKAEFAKIIWPTKDDLVKQTIAVATVSLILGTIIVSLDWVIRLGLSYLIK